jgi:hypothetical protein
MQVQTLRISVTLERSELNALVDMAAADCRHPREQARYLIRQEAARRGLLAAEANGERVVRTALTCGERGSDDQAD